MKFDPLTVECPTCGAKEGATCTNYKSQACAPHRARRIKSPEKRAAKKTWTQHDLFPQEK